MDFKGDKFPTNSPPKTIPVKSEKKTSLVIKAKRIAIRGGKSAQKVPMNCEFA